MPFKKGQSGNPGGRPKEDDEIKRLAREKGPDAIKRLAEWMLSDNPKASVAASQAILDRGFGKPTQVIAGDPDNPFMAVLTSLGHDLTKKLDRFAKS